MTALFRVALLGFSPFERNTLATCFRVAASRTPRYAHEQILVDAHFVVADAAHAPSVQLVRATERMADAVFVGGTRPEGAIAWLPRPLDVLPVLRELDALVSARRAPPPVQGEPPPARSEVPPATPAAPPQAATPPPAPMPSPDSPPSPPPPRPPRPAPAALIVDDSEVAQRFLQLRLAAYGMTAECVATAGQALNRLRRRGYEFVFLDMELGPASEHDGFGLCRKIKHEFATRMPPAQVVMVSAHHGELDRVRGALAGCDAFLGKPLDDAELDRLLRREGLERLVAQPKAADARDGAPAAGSSMAS